MQRQLYESCGPRTHYQRVLPLDAAVRAPEVTYDPCALPAEGMIPGKLKVDRPSTTQIHEAATELLSTSLFQSEAIIWTAASLGCV